MILLYSAVLQQEDFFNLLVWFFGFIIIFTSGAYFFKQKVFYLLSIIFTFILVVKSINYLIDTSRKSILNIYTNHTELIFITKRDNKIINRQVLNRENIHNLELKSIIEKNRGGLSPISGSTFHYKAIIYTNNKLEQKELISTRNMFDGKFITVNDLDEIFNKINK